MSWYLDNNDTLLLSSREVYGGRYIKADYIEFKNSSDGTNVDNTAFIDTGITDDSTTLWDVQFIFVTLATENWVAGVANLDVSLYYAYAGTSSGYSWYTDHMAYSVSSPSIGTFTTATKQSGGSTYTNPYNIIIGARNWCNTTTPTLNPSNGIADFKIYYFDIKKNGVKVAEFFPVYDPVNEEWGMYDVIGNQFHGNAGPEGSYIYGGYYIPESDIVTLTPEVLAFDYDHPPASMWILRDDIIVNALIPEPLIDDQGAFAECSYLAVMNIPSTVTSIGRYSFRDTAIHSITLPENCTYYSTSFPSGCTVTGGQLIS